MSDEDRRKPFFANKGDGEGFNYLEANTRYTIYAVIFFGLLFWAIQKGWL